MNHLFATVASQHRLLPRQGLTLVDQIAAQVLAGDDRVEVEPRVDDGDVAAVGVVADIDPAVEDRPVRRAYFGARPRRAPSDLQSAAERLELVDVIQGDERHVGDDPTQVGDRELLVDESVAVDLRLEVGRAQRMALGTPARLRHLHRRVQPTGVVGGVGDWREARPGEISARSDPERRTRRSSPSSSCRLRRIGTRSSAAH